MCLGPIATSVSDACEHEAVPRCTPVMAWIRRLRVCFARVSCSAASRRFSCLLLSHAPAPVLCVRCAAFSCVWTIPLVFIAHKKRHGLYSVPDPVRRRGCGGARDDSSADPLIEIPQAPHLFRRIQGLSVQVGLPGGLAPAPNAVPLSEIARVLGMALFLDTR